MKKQLLRYKRTIAVLIVIVLVLAFLATRNNSGQEQLPDIAIETVSIKDVERIVSVDGNLTGKDTREVFLPQSQVEDLKVGVGTRVKKGTDLAIVKVSGLTGEETQTFESPIAGIVTEVNVAEGDRVLSLGTPAFVIVDDSSYRIEVFVNENDVVNLRTKQSAELLFPAISLDESFTATVTSIAPAATTSTGVISYRTILTPSKLPDSIKLGMSVEVDITTALEEDVLAIPESFIIEKDDTLLLKKLNRNSETGEFTIEEIEIEIGLRTDELVEITSGVNEGAEIVEPSFTVERDGFGFF